MRRPPFFQPANIMENEFDYCIEVTQGIVFDFFFDAFNFLTLIRVEHLMYAEEFRGLSRELVKMLLVALFNVQAGFFFWL